MEIIVKAIIAAIISVICFVPTEMKVWECLTFGIIMYLVISWFWLLFKIVPLGIVLRAVIAFVVMALIMIALPELLQNVMPDNKFCDVLIGIICCAVWAIPVVIDVINVKSNT